MPIDYKKTREFIEKGIDPYIQPIRKFFQLEFDREHTAILTADDRITTEIIPMEQDVNIARVELDQELTDLEQSLDTKTNQLESQIDVHLTTNNPHQLRFKNLLTISANDPTNAQGNNTEFWMSYLNPVYSWVVGSWSACSVSCGGGVRTRTVDCTRNDGTVVNDSVCISGGMTKPAASEVCNTHVCYIGGIDIKRINYSDYRGSCSTNVILGVDYGSGDCIYPVLTNSKVIPTDRNGGHPTNWNFPFPIQVDNPVSPTRPLPLTITISASLYSVFSDDPIGGVIALYTQMGKVMQQEFSQSAPWRHCRATVTINHLPTIFKIYLYIRPKASKTEKESVYLNEYYNFIEITDGAGVKTILR